LGVSLSVGVGLFTARKVCCPSLRHGGGGAGLGACRWGAALGPYPLACAQPLCLERSRLLTVPTGSSWNSRHKRCRATPLFKQRCGWWLVPRAGLACKADHCWL